MNVNQCTDNIMAKRKKDKITKMYQSCNNEPLINVQII
jgi:hypothetical protein